MQSTWPRPHSTGRTRSSTNYLTASGRGNTSSQRYSQSDVGFAVDIARPEFSALKEILPSVDDAIILHILRGNGFDLERSADAALALAVSLSHEQGTVVFSEEKSTSTNNKNTSSNSSSSSSSINAIDNTIGGLVTNRNSRSATVPLVRITTDQRDEQSIEEGTKEDVGIDAILPPDRLRAPSSSDVVRPTSTALAASNSFWTDTFSSLAAAVTTSTSAVGSLLMGGSPFQISNNNNSNNSTSNNKRYTSDRNSERFGCYRGNYIKLPLIFLKPPAFRFKVDLRDNCSMNYSVTYRREQQLLGITIQEYRGEVMIVELLSKGPDDPHLALASGVQVGDTLIGINNEAFCPVAEVTDVLQILQLSGCYVTLNFRRRFKREKFDWSLFHPVLKLYVDHRVAKVDEVQLIDLHLRYLKQRSLHWDPAAISRRILDWSIIPQHTRRGSLGPATLMDPFISFFARGPAHVASADGFFEETPTCLMHGRRKSISSFPVYVSVDYSTNAKALDVDFSMITTSSNDPHCAGSGSSGVGGGGDSKRTQARRRKTTGSVQVEESMSGKLNMPASISTDGMDLSSIDQRVETAKEVAHQFHSSDFDIQGVVAVGDASLPAGAEVSTTTNSHSDVESAAVTGLKETGLKESAAVASDSAAELTLMGEDFKNNSSLMSQLLRVKSTLRPALSARLLRAEYFSELEAVVYVIWVLDVRSGVEWIVTRRFREFFELREQVVAVRSSIDRIVFPSKRVAIDAAHIAEERLPLLQQFLRRLCSIVCINTLHPSTMRLQMILQSFLRADDRIPMILQEEQWDEENLQLQHERILQVYMHNILHMPCMDKVVAGYIDSFLQIECKQSEEEEWRESHSMVLVNNMQLFIENLQNVLFDGFREDCFDILNQNKQRLNLVKPSGRKFELLPLDLNSDSSNVSVLPTPLQNSCSEQLQQQQQQQQRRSSLLADDAMDKMIRSVIRRQIEVEIYVGCSGRLRHVLRLSYAAADRQLLRKFSRIADEPQAYFGIPEHHCSPSNWDKVVYAMKEVGTKTLPYDKIETLLLVCKQIPALFQEEHYHKEGDDEEEEVDEDSYFSADDVLPIFIYILVRAQIPELLALNLELQCLCDPDKRLSEHGYYLATLEAGLQHLIQADVSNGSQSFLANLSAKYNAEIASAD